MSTIISKNINELIIEPYGETRSYQFAIGRTGPMKEFGLSIARADKDGRFFAGCIPIEDIDELIEFMSHIRGYNKLVKKQQTK